MKSTGQLEGRHAIREGYTHDSSGSPVLADKLYRWEGVRWHGITAMWRMDRRKPRQMVPVKKLTTLHGEQK